VAQAVSDDVLHCMEAANGSNAEVVAQRALIAAALWV